MKFLRRIRQNILLNGQAKKYLAYAIGEIILVMIGILLALQVNNWNEKRKDRQVEQKLLQGLEIEMKDNRSQMMNVIKEHKKNLRANSELINLYGKDISTLNEMYLDSLFSDYTTSWTYNPRVGQLNSIIMSGKLNYIKNEELKSYLSSFYDEAVDASELLVKFQTLKEQRLGPLLDKLISRKNKYIIWFQNEQLTKSSFQSNYQQLFKMFEAENIMSNTWTYLKYGITEEEEHLKSIDKILGLIEQELQKGSH